MPAEGKSPAALGFRMPAEWEPQAAIWLSWPHNRRIWPGDFGPILRAFANVASQVSRFEDVRINLSRPLQAGARRLIARAGGDLGRVAFYDHPTDDVWCRDHGPIFVKRRTTGEIALTHWQYNAWGGKYPRRTARNRNIPRRIARALGVRRFASRMVLEGGSIDVNGGGLLLTTESCLLNPNRNPRLRRAQIESRLRSFLGVRRVYWLSRGIAGDDTDGHVDDLARFFSADGIVASAPARSDDEDAPALLENLERIRSFRTPGGRPFRLVELPVPAPVRGRGMRLPATYANFLVINGAVLLPSFRQPRRDAAAAEVLRGCFPGREIVPIDCRDLVRGLGAIHCLTQQQPA